MKRLRIQLILLFVCLSTVIPSSFGDSDKKEDYPINELPMYGGVEKTEKQKQADCDFIETVTKDGTSRVEAAVTFAGLGWKFFYEGDKTTAIKRFNQAWLLDPENRNAYWGFAAISTDRNQVAEAVRFCELAMEKGPADPKLLLDYANALLRKAEKNTNEAKKLVELKQASALFEESSKGAPLNGHQLCQWAHCLYHLGKHDEAREKTAEAKQLDGHKHEELDRLLLDESDQLGT